MRRYAFSAVLAFALVLPVLAYAGDAATVEKWKQQWKHGEVPQEAQALKDQYGQISSEQAAALRDRAREAREKFPALEERLMLWEKFKNEHPGEAAEMKGTEEEQRQQWEEWKASHHAETDAAESKAELARKKWGELKASQSSDDPYVSRQKFNDLKFQNRDEALEARRKYEDWQRDNPTAVEGMKERYQQWQAERNSP